MSILKENIRYDFIDTIQRLAYEDENTRYPTYFMTFTDVPKLGIKPVSPTSTYDPLGIYGFPIAPYRYEILKFEPHEWKKIYDFFKKIDVSRFYKRDYIIFFTLKDFSKVWYLSDGFGKYKKRLLKYIEKLDLDNEEKNHIKENLKEIFQEDPNNLYNSLHDILAYEIIPMIDKRTSSKQISRSYKKIPVKLNKIFRSIGIEAIVDNVGHVLNEYEKYQIVVLNPTLVKIVELMDNPVKSFAEKYEFFHSMIEELAYRIPFDNEHDFKLLKSDKFKKFIKLIEKNRNVKLTKYDWDFLYKWLSTPGHPNEKKKQFLKNIIVPWR